MFEGTQDSHPVVATQCFEGDLNRKNESALLKGSTENKVKK